MAVKRCTDCELSDNTDKPCLFGRGSKDSVIMFIQDCPSELESQKQKQFYGKICDKLRESIERRGIPIDDCYWTSLVKCPLKDDYGDITAKMASPCLDRLWAEIEVIDPDIIVPMGKQVLSRLIGSVAITKLRGNAVEKEICGKTRVIMPIIHPRLAMKKPLYKTYILKDLDNLADLYENGFKQVSGVEYTYCETKENAIEVIQKFQNSEWLCFDLETTGTNPFDKASKIVCISLCDKPHTGVTIPLFHRESPIVGDDRLEVIAELKKLLENPKIKKIAQNGKFDIKWLKYWLDIDVANFCFDTMLAHYLGVSEEAGSQGLKAMAWEFTDMGGYDNDLDAYRSTLPKAIQYNYDYIPWEILRRYAAADVDCAFRMKDILHPIIYGNPKWKVLMDEFLMPASVALRDIEIGGMFMNPEVAAMYKQSYQAERDRIVNKLYQFPEVLELEREGRDKWAERVAIQQIPKKLRTPEEAQKFEDYKRYKDYTFNFGSQAQLKELLFNRLGLVTSVRTKKNELSCSKDALKEMAKQHELPEIMIELRKIDTLQGMFIEKLPTLRDEKGLLHSTFNIIGTKTGRMSSEDPNFQQLPRKTGDIFSFQYHNEPKALFPSRFNSMSHDYGSLKTVKRKGNGLILQFDYCLSPDTRIPLVGGDVKTLGEIVKLVNEGKKLFVYSINPETEKVVISKVVAGARTRINEKTLIVTLDNGEKVVCSYNHKFLLRTGQYLESEKLQPGMSLMSKSQIEVKAIELGETMDLYDIEVENFHNFALESGIFVHNSQLEIRVAGMISKDQNLLHVYQSGEDLHKATASKVWHMPIEEVTSDLRTQAKAVNFGVIYGKSGSTFGMDLFYGNKEGQTLDVQEARELGSKLVKDYLSAFPGLSQWIKDTVKLAKKQGYVETMFGRRRRLPDLKSSIFSLKAEAERQAVNAPIQGTGSDMTLKSIILIQDYINSHKLKSKMICTVHDSLVFDVYFPELQELFEVIKHTMEHVHEPYIDSPVPILAEAEMGETYGSIFEVDSVKNIITWEDYQDWLHGNKIHKYVGEIKDLHKAGWDYKKALNWLTEHQRPVAELKDKFIEIYSS